MLFRAPAFRAFPRISNVSSRAALPTRPQLLGRVAGAAGRTIDSPIQQQVRTMAGGRKKKGKKGGPPGDSRIRMIRYYLTHPAAHTPRPLKFGTMRMLRHWTIHRAWQLFKMNERNTRERELERQYNKIRDACEELAKTDGRLYRVALAKKEIGTFPVDIRIPTDTPGVKGWNYGWTRG